MCKKELKEFEKSLRDYCEEMTTSKEKSEEFLQRIGVITSNGKLSRNYSGLCTQQERG